MIQYRYTLSTYERGFLKNGGMICKGAARLFLDGNNITIKDASGKLNATAKLLEVGKDWQTDNKQPFVVALVVDYKKVQDDHRNNLI